MKSYIKALVFGSVLAGMTACTDLDTPITGDYVEFPDNEIARQSAFEACYHYTRNEAWFGRNFWEAMFLCGDEACTLQRGGGYEDGNRRIDGALHNFRPGLEGCGLMGDMLAGISMTNLKIKTFADPELGYKDPNVAPLRTIRAYYTFWMMEMYGDVPILLKTQEPGEEQLVERVPRAQVAEWIEQELLDAIPSLTSDNNISTYGRPNRWMAEALLVKLYLNWGVYTNPITTVTGSTPNPKLNECVKWCDDIIQNGPFEVGTGYRKKFFPDNGVHIKDFIYAVDFDPERIGNGTWKYAGGHETKRWWDYRLPGVLDPGTMGWNPQNQPAGCYILTPECVDKFNLAGDERNEMILVGPQYAFDVNFNKTTEVVYAYNNTPHIPPFRFGQLDYKKDFEWADIKKLDVGGETIENCMKGARLYKYPIRQSDDITWKGFQFNDIPVFRYADILLMKAECILRGATPTLGASAASLMNEVRDCSHAPHVNGTPTLDDLLDERCREFIMEPWRRNDLIRFGKFENCARWKVEASPETMSDLNKRLMPIPTGEMNTNTNWVQNPGY